MAPIRHVSHAIKTVPDSLSGGVQKIFTKVGSIHPLCTFKKMCVDTLLLIINALNNSLRLTSLIS